MDQAVIETIQQAGLDIAFQKQVPTIGIRVDDDGRLVPLGEEVGVLAGEHTAVVRLKKISELWTGDARPPDFPNGPTPAYLFFFATVEWTAADFCSCTGRRETDQEFLRLYTHLRRRPDGTDNNPLFSYIQAAVRLYLSIRAVSQAEFDAVVRRLARSARTFSEGYSSTNYLDLALSKLIDAGTGRSRFRRGAA